MRLRQIKRAKGAFRSLIGVAAAGALLATAQTATPAVPASFQEVTVFSGLTNPTAVRFARDGRVFVAEKSGRIKVYDGLSDASPTLFADLNANVYNFWDRGMLGLDLHPDFPTTPYVYVLYAHDAAIGGTAPRWGTPGVLSDPCPTPPGPTADGCVVSGRLSRLEAAGNVMTGSEQVLVEDWCQQYPSHSIGALSFGADGALYVSGGDGASFNFADWGQDGSPRNPCGDPPGSVGSALSPPTAEGGALRSQDLRTTSDPVSLDGTILRVDPITGAGLPDNPNALSSDPNARRIVAQGLRNPFRITVRPGTSQVWTGDVGWNTWEEVNRLGNTADAVVDNFGWPCYEGASRQSGYDAANLNMCENLYSAGSSAIVPPVYTWNHSSKVVSGESCPTGSSSAAGLAFYNEGNYPAGYLGALFFSDYSRDCIWVMFAGAGGVPDPATRQTFVGGAANPVDVQMGPNGDLFYVDFDGGTIRRVRYLGSSQTPTAAISADPPTGPAPLTVDFDGSSSVDPEGQALAYAWDLDDDGAYDDSTSAQPTYTYTQPGDHTIRLRVTDPGGATDTTSTVVSAVPGTAPVARIDTPSTSQSYTIGDLISFSGSATDVEDGTLPPAQLSWEVTIEHCPSNCHTHPFQDFAGTASGSFVLPDHEYPAWIELTLTATDSQGITDSETLRIDYRTVDLTFATEPSGLQLAVGASAGTAPFTRTVAVGSTNSLSALTPQTMLGTNYAFSSWSDAGAQTHSIVAPAAAATYTATYSATGTSSPGLVAAYAFEEGSGTSVADASGEGNAATVAGPTWTTAGKFGAALSFDGVNDLVDVADSSSLDLTTGMTLMGWVRPTALGTKWRTLIFKEQATNLVYGLYANRNTTRPAAEVHAGGKARTANGTSALALDAWSHVASTYDGSVLRLYVNGTQVATAGYAGSITTSSGLLRLGGNTIWGEYFEGLIDEVRVYNRPLSPGEIASDMNSPVTPPAPADSEPPGPAENLTATGGLGTATLDWTAATDNVGIGGYDVHRSPFPNFAVSDMNRIAQTTATSYVDAGLAAGTYHYRIVARDLAGNYSVPSSTATAVVTADTTGPTVAITAPVGGSTVTGSIQVAADATDDVAMAGVRFQLDGLDLGAEDTTAPYSVTWDSRTAANGSHSLTAIARDASGNPTNSEAVAVTVENVVAPPPPDLVAAYGFDEATGTTVADASGNGNTGTLSGPSWTDQGKFEAALSFDGTNDAVLVADSSSLDLTTGMTLMAWAKPSVLTNEWRTLIFKEQTTNIVYGLYANRNTQVPAGEIWAGGRARTVNGTAQIPIESWTHLALTYDGSMLRMFLNGAQVSTTAFAGSILASTGPLKIGGNGIWGEWFQGLIDEVRVYKRPLAATEIQTAMATAITPPGPADTQAPTAPGTLSATGGMGRADLAWGPASDDTGVTGYNVHRSTVAGFVPSAGNRIAGVTATSYADTGLAAGVYFYKLVAEDAAHNLGPPSNEASATATADETPPTVALTAPADGADVSGTVVVNADASDDVGVASVQFLIDGAALGAPDTVAPYSTSWDTRSVANGPHQLSAVARDAAGHATPSATVDVDVANTTVIPPGLVAALGLDEGAGSTAGDASGNGNAGTVAGATWTAAGRNGGALEFDGIDDLVTIADSPSLDLSTAMTLEAWVYPTALGSAWRTVVIKEQPGDLVYALYASASSGFPSGHVYVGGQDRRVRGTAALPLNAWTHLAVTYDGAAIRLYVNGGLAATAAAAGPIAGSTGALRLGGNGVWNEFLQGRLDDVRVYARVLSAAEIQADLGRAVP